MKHIIWNIYKCGSVLYWWLLSIIYVIIIVIYVCFYILWSGWEVRQAQKWCNSSLQTESREFKVPRSICNKSHYGHSISLCILKCSVRIQSRLPPMFVTVLCTIDERLCVSNTDNKASVVLPPAWLLPEWDARFCIFYISQCKWISFGFARENKRRRGTE